MKNIKQYAEDIRSMAGLLSEAADALDSYHTEQLKGVLSAMGISVPANLHIAKTAEGFAPPVVNGADQPNASQSATHALPGAPLAAPSIAVKIRKEYAELPPIQRTTESRLYLARKYSLTEKQVTDILSGPVQNGSLTRK